jgi:hypothetical protein
MRQYTISVITVTIRLTFYYGLLIYSLVYRPVLKDIYYMYVQILIMHTLIVDKVREATQ